MPTYRLTYFNARGFAETARMLFAIAGKEYEDVRIQREEWPALKPNTPFGQLPMLEVDGRQISQTMAIYRFLAKEFGLNGSSSIEQGEADMIVECLRDVQTALMSVRRESDEAKKAAALKSVTESVPDQLKKITAFIKGNFFLGAKISFVDVIFFNLSFAFEMVGAKALLDASPELVALAKRVENVPEIAAWIKKRPVTEM